MANREETLAALTHSSGPFKLVADPASGSPPLRVYANCSGTLRNLLIASAANGDKDFLVYQDERVSYTQHLGQVARLARWLQGQEVRKGDRVAIGMRNYPEWSVAFFACQAIGAIAVMLNAWWTGRELVYGLKDAGCCIAVLDTERMQRLVGHHDKLLELTFLITRDDAGEHKGHHWHDVLASIANDTLPEVDISASDYATIMYTSGTTGFPKGALHTQRNHITNIQNSLLAQALARSLAATATPEALPTTPSALQTFPFFHIGGISGLYIALATGAKLVTMYKWDTDQALSLIEEERLLSWSAVPTLVRQMLEHPRAANALASVASIASGGAPVPEDLINTMGTLFNARVAPGNGYGATETTSAIIVNGGTDYYARPRSVGRPAPTVDVRIVDDAGNDLSLDTIGELWVRGPNIFAGYWQNPQATDAAFDNGWFKTGDLGYVDNEGFYYVVDRKKDVIIRAGENVYCAEVEGVLHTHPGVLDVALIGLPHPSLGEEVAAVVELKPGLSVSEADLQAHVAKQLAHYNVPSSVFFVDTPLPRTATGKILKRELKERYS